MKEEELVLEYRVDHFVLIHIVFGTLSQQYVYFGKNV